MKIHGVEGLSPETLRDEVNRGGRFVIYTYCVSVLIMTFKRPTGVYFIKPGSSPVVASLPFVGVSLLFGWWGFPWGPIYSIETIYKNLCGGIDVTDDIVREFAPSAGPVVPPPMIATPAPATFQQAQTTGYAQPVTHEHAAIPRREFNFRVAAMMVLAVCLAVVIGISGYCYYQQTHLPVVLVSGMDTPYTIKLNGEEHTLQPHAARVLTLSEGEFTIEDAGGTSVVGSPRTAPLSIPFLDHLGTEKLAVINPDRLAVVYEEEVPYYKDGTTAPKDEVPGFTLLVNQWSYFIAKPDFVLTEPDQRIDMPSGTTRVVKHRLETIANPDLDWLIEKITERNGYAAARDYIMNLAVLRTDEDLLMKAMTTLHDGDVPAFFDLHLADRPVMVDWHRYYQRRIEQVDPKHDVVAEYRALLEAEPGNGALSYLLGRAVPGHAEQAAYWKRALAATPPCNHAWNALGFDAMSVANFDEAIDYFDEAVKAGLATKGLKAYRRQSLIAAGRGSQVTAEISAERKSRPLDIELAEEEMVATFAARHDIGTAKSMKDAFLAAIEKTKPTAENRKDVEAYLQAVVADLDGDLANYARCMSHFTSPYYAFRAAVASGDAAGAIKIVDEHYQGDPSNLLLAFLLAIRSGDHGAADREFAAAREALISNGTESRAVAAELAKNHPSPAVLCEAHIEPESKRVLMTALGVRYPEDRETYFAMARRLNFNPAFPQRFLNESLQEPVATTQL